MQTIQSPDDRRRAFTIVELLVVVAVLGLLIGLLVPALSAVGHRSRVAKDASQLRNLQMAHYQYALESKGKFADVGLTHGGHEGDAVPWIETLSEYTTLQNAAHSPLDESPHWPKDEGGNGTPIEGTTDQFRRTSYGWNNYLSRSLSPDAAIDPRTAVDRLGRVKNPANTIHFVHMAWTGDFAGADHLHVEGWWVADSLPDAPIARASSQMQINSIDDDDPSWASRSNYGFVDGSVRELEFVDVYHSPERNRFMPDIAAQTSLFIRSQEES